MKIISDNNILVGKSRSLMNRYKNNPILGPDNFTACKAEQVLNPGQVMTPEGKTILVLNVSPQTRRTSCCYVAESDDGINFHVHEEPIFSVENDKHYENLDFYPGDCRITWFEEDQCYYITRPGNSDWGCCALLYKTTDFVQTECMGVIALPHNRVPCIFPEKINGKYLRIDRPYSLGATYDKSFANLWLSYSDDLIHWGEHKPLLKHGYSPWNNLKIGPTVPIKTEKGWLEIIHGVRNTYVSWRYSLGAILLDLEDPSKIIGCMKNYILTPETTYECNGIVPNVVFASGGIADLKKRLLRIYYGASDTYTCLAEGNLDDIIDACIMDHQM